METVKASTIINWAAIGFSASPVYPKKSFLQQPGIKKKSKLSLPDQLVYITSLTPCLERCQQLKWAHWLERSITWGLRHVGGPWWSQEHWTLIFWQVCFAQVSTSKCVPTHTSWSIARSTFAEGINSALSMETAISFPERDAKQDNYEVPHLPLTFVPSKVL